MLNVQLLDALRQEKAKDIFLSFVIDSHLCNFHMRFAQC